jgi:hypothetical protein
MLKTLCYISDRDSFEFIAVSESGRLSTCTKNPFEHISEIQDLEDLLTKNLEACGENKPESWVEIVAAVHQYNETVSTYERVRYLKTITPQVAQMINMAVAHCDSRHALARQQNHNTIIDLKLKVVKVEKDGE